MIERIKLWHEEAVVLVARIAGKEHVAPPTYELVYVVDKVWAYYQAGKCNYSLSMAKLEGDAYRDTVIHEVCHHYARDGHGPKWAALMVACGLEPTPCGEVPDLATMYRRMR